MRRNKKIIAIIIATIILAIAATTGIIMYLNDDGTASAGFEDNNPGVSQDGENKPGNNDGEEQNPSSEPGENPSVSDEPGNLPGAGENESQTGGTTTKPGTTGNTGTTTGSGNTNIPNQEFVTERIEEIERQITEDLLVGWTPLGLKSAYSTSGLGIYKPELQTAKIAVTENNKDYVFPGEIITYGIAVQNVGNDNITGINVSDIIPEQTTLVENSMYIYKDGKYADAGSYNEKLNKLNWKIDIKTTEVVVVGFAVTVNKDATGTIKNKAIVNGNETNEVETPVVIIDGQKLVDKTVAWVGEELLYTIRLTNKGVVPGTATITDQIPEGTTYVENSVDEKGKYNKETNTIEWTDVEVTPETPVELSFKVKIDLDRTTSVLNTAMLNDEQIPEQPETKVINIIGEKSSKHEEILTEEGKIDYTITLTNIGNATGKINVTDKIPEGTTYVENSVDAKGVYNAETNTIEWKDVEVTPETPVELTFSVTVNPFDQGEEEKEIVNQASIGNEVTDIAVKKLIDKTVNKQWKNDTIMLRENIEVELLANGEKTGNIITLTTRNMWQETFKDLPKYDAKGKEIVYTIVELTKIEGYTSEVKDMTIINTYEEPTIDVTATKIWSGDNDSHIRPDEIEVQLYADGNPVNEGNKIITGNKTENTWTVEYTGLPKYRTGTRTLIEYTIKETTALPEGYEKTEIGMTVTNTYTEPTVDKTATKVWVGDETVKTIVRPSSIQVQLYADDVAVTAENGGIKTITPDAQGNWATEYTGLPKYDYTDGTRKEITYTIKEITQLPDGYEKTESGMTVTNTYTEPTVDKTATKVWVGDETVKTIVRPSSIQVQLYADDVAVTVENGGIKTITPDAEGNWATEFTGLPKYDYSAGNRTEIVYSIVELEKEQLPEGYNATESGMTVTNTYTEPTVSKTATKVWVGDEAVKTIVRPASIQVQLYADDVVILAADGGVKTITPDAQGNWATEYTGLPKYDYTDGTRKEITYTIKEVTVLPDGYEKTERGMTVTNTYTEPTVSKIATKVWVGDEAVKDIVRPASIEVQLYADDVAVTAENGGIKTITPDAQGSWKIEYTGLAKYDYTDGTRKEITYTIKEITVLPDGYEKTERGMTVTNTYTEPTVSKTATKVWVGDEAVKDIVRPASIKVQLYADDVAVTAANGGIKTITSNGTNTWTVEYPNLQKYRTGTRTPIEYTIREITTLPEGYAKVESGMTVTNTYTEPKVSVSVEKVWNDNSNATGVRPNSVTVKLLAGGNDTGKTVTLNSSNSWKDAFTNLNKYTTSGTRTKINYTVQEVVPTYYTVGYTTLSDTATGKSIKITNTLITYTQYTANVEELSTTQLNKNVYIVLDASSSMNYPLVEKDSVKVGGDKVTRDWLWADNNRTTQTTRFNQAIKAGMETKMKVAGDVLETLIKRIYNLSSASTVKVITFNSGSEPYSTTTLKGTGVFGSATNPTSGDTLATSIGKLTEAPRGSYGPYKTWGTHMYAALDLLENQIDADIANGVTTTTKDIVIFLGDGAPTNNGNYNKYNGSNINAGVVTFSNNVPSGKVITKAKDIRGKVSAFYTLGVSLILPNDDDAQENYTTEQAEIILRNLGTNYWNVNDLSSFNTAFDTIFSNTYTKNRLSENNAVYSPIITITPIGEVITNKTITVTVTKNGVPTKYEYANTDALSGGISFENNKFKIDTSESKFKGNILLQYAIK